MTDHGHQADNPATDERAGRIAAAEIAQLRRTPHSD